MKADDAKRLKELKELGAEQALDIDVLKEVFRGNFRAPNAAGEPWLCLSRCSGFLSGGPAGCSVNTAPHSGCPRRLVATLNKHCGHGCGRSPLSTHCGVGARRTPPSVPKDTESNHKHTQRLWREKGLKRPQRTVKKRRAGLQRGDRLVASHPEQMWALDFQYDVTSDGRQLRLCDVIDEFTREAFATRAARSFTSNATIAVLEEVIAATGCWPADMRMDNGTELAAHAMAGWCRLSRMNTAFIEPGSPWQNPWIESFHSLLRDECTNLNRFRTILEARIVIGDWRQEYNHVRPHSSQNYLTPAGYAETCTHRNTQ